MADDTRWIVVGASGFIGRHLMARLCSDAATVIGTRRRPGERDLIQYDVERDDLADRIGSAWLTDNVVAIHCIAFGGMDACLLDRERSWNVEVAATQRLMTVLAERNVRQVFLSSSCVFDGLQGNYQEDDPRRPLNEYGRHKVAVEQFLAEQIPDALVLRLDKVVGKSPQEDHLLSQWWRALERGSPLCCFKDHVFSPVLVDDVVQVAVAGARAGRHGVYHVAGPEAISRLELAQQFCKAFRVECNVFEATPKELGLLDERPRNSSLNIEKLQRDLGFTPASPGEMIARFVAAVRNESG